jgi:hypothetical protein
LCDKYHMPYTLERYLQDVSRFDILQWEELGFFVSNPGTLHVSSHLKSYFSRPLISDIGSYGHLLKKQITSNKLSAINK